MKWLLSAVVLLFAGATAVSTAVALDARDEARQATATASQSPQSVSPAEINALRRDLARASHALDGDAPQHLTGLQLDVGDLHNSLGQASGRLNSLATAVDELLAICRSSATLYRTNGLKPPTCPTLG